MSEITIQYRFPFHQPTSSFHEKNKETQTFRNSQNIPMWKLIAFLDAPSHLYKRAWPSVRRSVRPSVHPSVRRSIRPQLFSKKKSTPSRRIFCRVSGLVVEQQLRKHPNLHTWTSSPEWSSVLSALKHPNLYTWTSFSEWSSVLLALKHPNLHTWTSSPEWSSVA